MTKRIRIIAGPNGSGKSTTITKLLKVSDVNETYINIDDIQSDCKKEGRINCEKFGFRPNKIEFESFALKHGLNKKYWYIIKLAKVCPTCIKKQVGIPSFEFNHLKFDGYTIVFPAWLVRNNFVTYYFSTILADYFRHTLLHQGRSFTFETVMSDYGKIQFMKLAASNGFLVELHYVATDDAKINIGRVRDRVKKGGHDVPQSRIVKRYSKSLDLLYDAVISCSVSFLWDNSRGEGFERYIGEVKSDGTFDMNEKLRLDEVPRWFDKYLFEKARAITKKRHHK